MSKFLEFGAAGGAAVVLVIAYNFADRNVAPMPDAPDRSEAIAEYTAPPPSPMMAAVAQNGEGNGKYGLGRPALPEEIAAWDVDITPDGTGLPEGSGDVWDGEALFEENCAVCHGSFAEGVDNWPALAGGMGSLDHEDPVKTVGSYWPYLSTAWDYIHRSMPYGNAQSLEADDVYAITAYILFSNNLVDDDFVLSKDNFLSVEMPNADGFFVDDREEVEAHFWDREPCMENCKDSVEITMRAAVLDVTPEDETAEAVEEVFEETDVATEAAVEEAEEVAATARQPEETDAAGDPMAGISTDPELVAAGERVWRQCQACHQVGDGAKHRTGPHLNEIWGRVAGTAEDFRYSGVFEEFAEEGLVWTPETMTAFLEDPRGYARGTRMSFRGLDDEDDLQALFAYLAAEGG